MLGDVMNKTLMATILATCTLFAIPSVATASDYGCKVLLCLAASGGTPAECKPTLKKLYRDLSKGRGFPSCKMESGPGDSAGAEPVLPKPRRGVAVFVPTHTVCKRWEQKSTLTRSQSKYCADPKTIEQFYDHSGKSCQAWFPKTSHRPEDDNNYSIRSTCQANSKRYVKVEGAGVSGDYHYY
jgi:hypothetical protein